MAQKCEAGLSEIARKKSSKVWFRTSYTLIGFKLAAFVILCAFVRIMFSEIGVLFSQLRMTLESRASKAWGLHHDMTLTHSDDIHWMQRDFYKRWKYALESGRQPPMRRFLVWLHIPKTGTSFANSLVRWGCPDAPREIFVIPASERPLKLRLSLNATMTWDWLFTSESGRSWLRTYCIHRLASHAPTGRFEYSVNIHAPLRKLHINNTIAMFRLPLQRTYSNYLHIDRHYNESRDSRMTLTQFVQKPKFISQQAKLLLGYRYRYGGLISNSQALEAAKLINNLAFVGLTEQFDLSVRLFHAKFGGVPHRSQFENVRPSIQRYQSVKRRYSWFRYSEREFGEWRDEPDEIVYRAAHSRFWREICHNRQQIGIDGLGLLPAHVCISHSTARLTCQV